MRARIFTLDGWMALLVASLCALGGTAWAQAEPEPPSQASIDALNTANAAVVGLDVTIIEGARSADTLGEHRVGSGVVIGDDGLILTIGYLMLEADSIQIVTRDQRKLPARPVGYDQATGFGLVKSLLPLRIKPVPLGSHQDLTPGDALMAASGGEGSQVGITRLMAKRPFSGYWEYHIDAALFTSPPLANHSGASLFNKRGELLGIGSLFVMDAMQVDGAHVRIPGNMFVPVDLLKPILEELQRTGTSKQSHRPWLGLTSTEEGGQVQVLRVTKDSPAAAAGIHGGDVVLAVDGVRVRTLEEFYKRIWARPQPDDAIKLTVQQGEESRELVIKGIDRSTTIVKPKGI